ncbi:uncharacterized protein LOC144010583 [Festucalex cinctus]
MKLKGAPWRRDARAASASYRRHADEAERRRRHGQVRYQPLLEQEVEEEKRSKREKRQRVGKKVSKALRSTWKCLMLGLYNLAAVYSAPASVAAAFVPDFSPARNTP